jgi:hypothetical protein
MAINHQAAAHNIVKVQLETVGFTLRSKIKLTFNQNFGGQDQSLQTECQIIWIESAFPTVIFSQLISILITLSSRCSKPPSLKGNTSEWASKEFWSF